MTDESPVPPGSRIAIAGASGLIGSALARSLADDGHEVLRLVRRAP
ncbi:NAD-dependent epimerase/dehydratase family protein, partial [Streptomyces scabiei]